MSAAGLRCFPEIISFCMRQKLFQCSHERICNLTKVILMLSDEARLKPGLSGTISLAFSLYRPASSLNGAQRQDRCLGCEKRRQRGWCDKKETKRSKLKMLKMVQRGEKIPFVTHDS